jgi:CheY-like chemotaxis protein
MTGYEVLQCIKQKENNVNCQFIFLSAYVEEDDIRRGMNLGADDYLTKPFSINVLLETVKSRLAIAEKKRDLDSIAFSRKIFEFVNTNFVHEFFTPLHMIMSLSKILMRDDSLMQNNVESLETIYSSGVRIYKNIKVIVVNTIISNREKYDALQLENISLSDMLNKTRSQFFENVNFSTQIAEGIYTKANYEIISFLFEETLYNANKFKKPDTAPEVTLQKENGKILFKVKNQTIDDIKIDIGNIAPFKKFQSNLSLNGWGLGLYTLVKSCNLIGSDIFIDSSNNHFEITISLMAK